MRIGTPSEILLLERQSGISEETLMESAGSVAAREILQRYAPEIKQGTVAIFCGPGNNGADGLVIARHLAAAGGAKIIVYSLVDAEKADLPDFSGVSLVIDALYGIGLNRPLQGTRIEQVINAINNSKKPVIAIDAPSGLNCETGTAGGVAVKADLTLTFTLPKLGFFTATGSTLCGAVRVLPIGIPLEVINRCVRSHRLFTERWAKRLLPDRPLASNKSTFGHLVVCAGRPGFWGAGVLATQAAFRIGSGYVTWAAESAPVEELRVYPEVLTSALADLDVTSSKYAAFVVGPGLGTAATTLRLIESLAHAGRPTVLDADALTVLSQKPVKLPKDWLLTPHSGELSRLIGRSVEEIEANRFDAAKYAAKKFGCLVLLKGYRTIIASDKKSVIIHSGNPALAKAGTGDVLAGLIGGLLAQGLTIWKAASLGAYIHGRLADDWLRSGRDVASLVASDLAAGLPPLLADLRG